MNTRHFFSLLSRPICDQIYFYPIVSRKMAKRKRKKKNEKFCIRPAKI